MRLAHSLTRPGQILALSAIAIVLGCDSNPNGPSAPTAPTGAEARKGASLETGAVPPALEGGRTRTNEKGAIVKAGRSAIKSAGPPIGGIN